MHIDGTTEWRNALERALSRQAVLSNLWTVRVPWTRGDGPRHPVHIFLSHKEAAAEAAKHANGRWVDCITVDEARELLAEEA